MQQHRSKKVLFLSYLSFETKKKLWFGGVVDSVRTQLSLGLNNLESHLTCRANTKENINIIKILSIFYFFSQLFFLNSMVVIKVAGTIIFSLHTKLVLYKENSNIYFSSLKNFRRSLRRSKPKTGPILVKLLM